MRRSIRKVVKKTRQHELQRLIKQAQSQPGVTELMQVHEIWRKFEKASSTQRRLVGIARIVSMSDTSHPEL